MTRGPTMLLACAAMLSGGGVLGGCRPPPATACAPSPPPRADSTGGGRVTLPADALPADVLLHLRSRACLGTCPSYELTVFDDGRWRWHGDSNVVVRGPRRGRLSERRMTSVVRGVECLRTTADYPWLDALDAGGIELTLRDGTEVARLLLSASGTGNAAVELEFAALRRALPMWRLAGS